MKTFDQLPEKVRAFLNESKVQWNVPNLKWGLENVCHGDADRLIADMKAQEVKVLEAWRKKDEEDMKR